MGAGPASKDIAYELPLGALRLRGSNGPGAGAQTDEASSAPRRLSPDALGEHVDRLYRAAWAMTGNREDAEDLVQETFARVLTRPRLVRGGSDQRYLVRALRNTFFDTRRSAARRPSTEELPDEASLIDHREHDPADRVARHDALFAAIAALADDHRDALVAVDIVGLSYREAARAFHTREETLATRLFRARQQVARHIEAHAPDEAPTPQRRRARVQA